MVTNTFQHNYFRQPQKTDAKTTQNQVFMTPGLNTPMRWVARLILTIICFVWYSSSVYAVVDRINQPPVINRIENVFPLGAELEHLRKDLLQAEKTLAMELKSLEIHLAGRVAVNVEGLEGLEGLEDQPELPLESRATTIIFNSLPDIKKLDKKQRQQMAATLQHYKDHQLAEQIIQRQVSENLAYASKMASLYQALNAIDTDAAFVNKFRNTNANRNTAEQLHNQLAYVKEALALLAQPLSNMPQRYSNNFDFVTPPPRDIYTLQSQIDSLIGTDAGNYTATDSATNATQAISDKVTELGVDPLTLYNWVHDTIRWLPSYGVMQGADYTMQAEQGNAFDTASLLIALLREAGHEARYRYGIAQAPVDQVRNWVGDVKNADAATNLLSQGGIPQTQFSYGGAIEEIKFEHVWVEVKQGGDWLPLDPSYKQYTYSEGMDLKNAVSFDAQSLLTQLQNSAISNEAEGWVQGVDASLIETELNNYQSQLEAYLNANAPQATLGGVLGFQTINPSEALTLQEAEPSYAIGLNTAVDQLPGTLFHRFHFQLGSAVTFDLGTNFEWGSELFSIDELTTNVVGKDIAISFRPATQTDEDAIASFLPEIINGPEDLPDTLPASAINMVGELTIDGQVIYSTNPMTLGTALKTRLGFQPAQGSYSFTENDLDAGQYQAITMDMQGVSPTQLEALQAKLENTQTQLEAGNAAALTKHDVVGDILQAGIQGYMAMTYATDRIAAQAAGIVYYRQPSYGTFSTALTVAYNLGGTPAQVTFSGVVMDVDRMVSNVEEKKNCYEGFVAFNRASGMRNSAYEHQIPERLFSTETEQAEGVSTAKALSLAMAQGQRIYTLTSENASQLSNVTIDDGARAEIQQALSLGLEVTVHQSPITVNGWQGSGYSVLDPEYGVGAYQITGGVSGGVLNSLPDPVGEALGFLGSMLGLGSDIFSEIFKDGPFKAINKAIVIASNILTALFAFTDCSLSDALVVLMPLFLGGVWIALLGPAGLALGIVARIIGTFIISEAASLASASFKEVRC